MFRTPAHLALVLMLALAACGQEDARTEFDRDSPASVAEGLGVQNVAAPLPGLVTAAQPTREQVESMMERGYRSFISLQLEEEPGAGWEEEGVARSGGRFARIPVAGPDDLTRENVEKLAAILEEAAGDPTVLYCASSNRVGALLALKAYWLDGAEPEDALALGRRAGLRALEPSVRSLLAEER